MMLAPGVCGAIVARMAQNILVFPESLLHQIKVPALRPWDEPDAVIPFSNAADHLRDIKGSRRMAFPGVGHFIASRRTREGRYIFAKFHDRTNPHTGREDA
jgi:pimeloyl-ACP methyl ester carboxylesterase